MCERKTLITLLNGFHLCVLEITKNKDMTFGSWIVDADQGVNKGGKINRGRLNYHKTIESLSELKLGTEGEKVDSGGEQKKK